MKTMREIIESEIAGVGFSGPNAKALLDRLELQCLRFGERMSMRDNSDNKRPQGEE